MTIVEDDKVLTAGETESLYSYCYSGSMFWSEENSEPINFIHIGHFHLLTLDIAVDTCCNQFHPFGEVRRFFLGPEDIGRYNSKVLLIATPNKHNPPKSQNKQKVKR